jgi:hypothetical protein
MVGCRVRGVMTWLGLAAMSGCDGGVTVQTLALAVTLGIFVGTLLLERSP